MGKEGARLRSGYGDVRHHSGPGCGDETRRGVSGDFEIYSMAANGTELNPLTENVANDLNPAWSPDRKKIAFHSDRDGNGEIYVMDADGTDQPRLTVSANPAHENNPDWQPGP